MSRDLFKMNMIASVQKLDDEDIETIQNYIKKIEEENKILLDANEYHQNIIHELETIKQPNQLYSENVKLRAENNKLNNIINELNYGIKELDNMFYETFRISQNGYYSISEWELKEFTDKLQELKESNLAIPPEVIGTNGVDGGLFDYGDR